MRKISLILAIILCLSVFSACGTATSASAPAPSSEPAAAAPPETALAEEPASASAPASEEASSESASEHGLEASPANMVDESNAFDFVSRTITLNNGIEMPIVGIGMFTLTQEEAENSVYTALTSGYKLIDTANAYNNEEGVGAGIVRSGVPREEIFVTTKLWPSNYENVSAAVDETLERLGLEYIDLLLLHQPYENYVAGYLGMEEAVAAGKVRSIGLSNFNKTNFAEIMEVASITPAVLQVESNPWFHQTEMREFLKQYGTVMNAWFPLGGRGQTQDMFSEPTIVEIAAAHNVNPAQVVLRWHLQIGNIAIPGSTNPEHIVENISNFNFELTSEEMEKISAMDRGVGSFDFSGGGEVPNFGSFEAP